MLKKIISLALAGMIVSLCHFPAQATSYDSTRYVRIDLKDHTAFIYDENFRQLPAAPDRKRTSAEFFPQGESRWFLGYDVDVVRRNADGSTQILSSDPAYSEMNHHFIFRYVRDVPPPQEKGSGRILQKISEDDQRRNHKKKFCGQYPLTEVPPFPTFCDFISTGSELTGFRLPKGYGIEVKGGYLRGGTWHWDHSAEVSKDEEIYLRYVLHWDDNPTGYRSTYVAWISVDLPKLSFCIEPGSSQIEGPDYEVNQPIRIVAIIPHTHDHTRYLELRRNDKPLRRFSPKKALFPAKHTSCGMESTPLHASPDHLSVRGLTPWTPGEKGPVLKAGDKLKVFASFSSPHKRPIDNMIILKTYWESLQDSPEP